MNENEDLFLTVNTYPEEGTLEERWGPFGYIVCRECNLSWVCHFNAWFVEHGSKVHKCGTDYRWMTEVEHDKYRNSA